MKAVRAVRAVLAAGLLALALVPLTAGEASAASHRIVMKGYAFGPRTLTISAGDTVTWVNQDTAPHDVKTTSGPAAIHSPMLNKGDTWSFTFTAAGSYGYLCTVHPGMTGNLVVKPAAPATTAAPTHAHGDHGGSHPSAAPPTAGASAGVRTGAAATASAKAPSSASGSAEPTPASDASTSAAAGAPSAAAPSTPPATAPPPQAAVSAPAGAGRPLDPLLVLAGAVAGVSVLCLLLVGSRTATARAADTGASSAGS
ncbi:cupredoxin family copper-binding protein [Streptomyces sp. NPDC005962]|uniref:cupredoxin domain-containing protein n=1 Tax=Streptomyces sp. NPDC005962 TaxID=3154466 RepID=UPI0033CA2CE6